jgi:uncharacterized protein (TIGR03067 family)
MRRPGTFCLLILVFQATASSQADEKTIKGKITAVDTANHSIAVQSVTPDDSGRDLVPVTLDVIRKTRMTVEGEPARLANIKVGQSVIVTYDDKLEVATVIAVRESLAKDEEKTAADLKLLQGNWIGVAETGASGEILDKETVKERDRRVTISGNNFTMKRTLDNRRGTFAGKLEINAALGHFDFIGKGPNGELSEWIGIYEIKNDTCRLCYNMKTAREAVRPEKFGPDEHDKNPSRIFTLKREVD